MKGNRLQIFLLFTLLLAVLLTACGGESNEVTKETDDEQEQSTNSDATDNDQAIDYPTKSIEIIVPFAAGGGTDAVGRVVAETLKSVLGVDVVVVNREGGSGAVGMNDGLQSEPDGYVLTLASREIVSLPLLDLAPFETSDFKFVSNINMDPAMLVVNADSEYETFEDLLDALKNNPGKLKNAASTQPSYYALQFMDSTDVEFQSIPYQGANPAITDILAGEADFGLYSPGESKAHIDGGGLRALAIMSEERIEGFPDVPTMAELGFEGAISGTYRGIVVPGDTPDEIVKVLEEAFSQVTSDEKFLEFMDNSVLGVQYMGSNEFTSFVENDSEVLAPLMEAVK